MFWLALTIEIGIAGVFILVSLAVQP